MTLEQRITALAQAIGADVKTLSGLGTWGNITGTLSNQTDLQSALDGKQAADADLTAIAGLSGNYGLLKKVADTWQLDTSTYLSGTSIGSGSYVRRTGPSISGIRYNATAIVAGADAQNDTPIPPNTDYVTVLDGIDNPGGVTLPQGILGLRVVVINIGINNLNVYPGEGWEIVGAGGADLPIVVSAGTSVEFIAAIGVGQSGIAWMPQFLQTVSSVDGQTGAVDLSSVYQPILLFASQAEMEAGTESALRSMSPLNVAQAIAALASTSGNLDGGSPSSNYGGISSIDAGGV